MAGAGPDVLVEVHDLLLEGELCPRDLHPAGEDSLERQCVGGDGGVHHHVVHETSLDGGSRGIGIGRSAEHVLRTEIALSWSEKNKDRRGLKGSHT